MTHLPVSATPGKRRDFAEAVRAMSPWTLALAVAAVAYSTVAMAALPASWLHHAAAEAQVALPTSAIVPSLLQDAVIAKARARRSGCASCGVIETIRRIEPAGDLPAAFEFTVRLRDGSLRISSSATQDKWRSGDRIMFIGGIAPPIRQ